MSTEPAPKIFLQNKLSKSRAKLEELAPMIASRRKSSCDLFSSKFDTSLPRGFQGGEMEQFSKLAAAYTKDSSLGKIDDISDVCFHQLAFGIQERTSFVETSGNQASISVLHYL